jgi:hypothetical protein
MMTKLKLLLALAALAGVCINVYATPDSLGSPTGETAQAPITAGESKPKVLNPMREKEPMPGEMKRPGMIKEDVHTQAMKKDAIMQDAMKKEEINK